jgi:phage shock protein PspC (stress-responsive transcriptional regulator)
MTEKRLTRSRIDHKLGGVCGGLAEYLDVDATLIRVLAVLAILVTLPVSLVAYVVLWAVIPEAPLQYAASRETTTG